MNHFDERDGWKMQQREGKQRRHQGKETASSVTNTTTTTTTTTISAFHLFIHLSFKSNSQPTSPSHTPGHSFHFFHKIFLFRHKVWSNLGSTSELHHGMLSAYSDANRPPPPSRLLSGGRSD
ncbi:hypothetical protein E2C01_092014 [Portunus trituberculatus]|uniref:Uncharacterized protein n=1 Tax=Portunus trituberculatus TaxID=210409 RepID=A0A5B7JUG3_PORTR|nr:hypothetical protein [Portunus trituberculatus]